MARPGRRGRLVLGGGGAVDGRRQPMAREAGRRRTEQPAIRPPWLGLKPGYLVTGEGKRRRKSSSVARRPSSMPVAGAQFSSSRAREMSQALVEGGLIKTYLAVADGIPGARSGTINMPLRIEKGESSRAVPDRAGQQAVTHFSCSRHRIELQTRIAYLPKRTERAFQSILF